MSSSREQADDRAEAGLGRAGRTEPDDCGTSHVETEAKIGFAKEDLGVEERASATRRESRLDGEAGEGDQTDVDEADCRARGSSDCESAQRLCES